MQWLFRPLAWLVVPAAAFLTFLIQPLVGKQLIPRYGGTAGTWMTVSFFFQVSLLAGYALAYQLLGPRRRHAGWVVAALAALAALSLRLPPWHFAGLPEWPAVVLGLTLAVLPTVLLSTSIGIVLQGWLRERTGRVPYWLYGVSNLGSLLALVVYPFVVEPFLGLSVQVGYLRWLVIALAAACLVLAFLQRGRTATVEAQPPEPEEIRPSRIAVWAATAFATCTLMLSAVHILSAEIGSNPLSWLIPLGIYLLSFTFTFSGWWRPGLTQAALAVFGFAVFGYSQAKGVSNLELTETARTWMVVLLASGCLAGHGFLFQRRPERRFTLFYLVLASAGAAAGLFASVGAPVLFDRNLEFMGAAFCLGLGLALTLVTRADWSQRTAVLVLAFGPALYLTLLPVWREHRSRVTIVSYHRNHYGTIRIEESPAFVMSSSETTVHGVQLREENLRRTPTAYYCDGSAIAVVMKALQAETPSLRTAVIGLGTGTMAAFNRPGDSLVFWDINPLVEDLARSHFTFLADQPGRVEVRIADGRIGVRTAPETFDLLLVDAFSGDYIPVHLLTREAVEEYLAKVPRGLLVFHVSNRYVDLFPILATHARDLGLHAVSILASPSRHHTARDEPRKTHYVLLYRPDRAADIERWLDQNNVRPDFDYTLARAEGQPEIRWTDDRNGLAEVLWPK